VAGVFDAKVDISTRDATDNLAALRKEVKNTSSMLLELDKALKATSGGLKETADSLTKIIAAQRSATAGNKAMAQAQIATARAQGITNVATAKATQLNAAATNQQAQATRATAQAGTAAARTAQAQQQTAASAQRMAQSAQNAAQSQNQMGNSLSNSRYLMYDVGATYGVISAALMTIPAATAAVAAAYQKDFAQVVRVNEDFQNSSAAAQEMKNSLKDLAVEMPVAFGELSRITQLGSQMGVTNDKLEAFTETTAKFVAVTGISADTGATLFGRMETAYSDEVAKFPDFFEKLGSSIAYVGAKTVATDPEIAAMLNQIGPLAAAAGMGASEVTGLSAALASVRVRPELARGALTKVFANINRDVAEGSPRLAEYGKVMGITGDAAAKLWKSDSSKFFTDLVAGLNQTLQKNGELTTTLDDLGIKELRVSDAMTKLAVGNDVLVKSMDAANKGFEEGTALNEMSKPVFETVAAKLTEMANAWKNLGDTLGAGALGPLALFVDAAKNTAIWLRSISEDAEGVITPLGHLLQILMGFAAVTALFLGFKAAQAFVMAGMIGFQQAAARGMSGGLGLSNMMRTLAQTMLMAKGATDQQSRALLGQTTALRALSIAAMTNGNAIAGMGARHAAAATGVALLMRNVQGAGTAMLGMVGGPIGIVIGALALLAGGFINASMEAEQAGKAIAEAMQQGADSGRRAIATSLNNRKVQLLPTEGDISFSKLGQSVTEVARQVDVDFADIVKAVEGGTDSAEAFKNKMVELQKKTAGTDKFKADAYAWLGHVATEMANSEKTAAAGLKDVAKAAPLAGAGFKDLGDEGDKASLDIDKLTDALKALNDEVFGTLNAESALQAALANIGEGLQKSQSYSPMSEGGRENIENFQDALTKARDYYNQLRATNQLSAQEAAQGYAEFVQGLVAEIKNGFGGDTSYVEQLAEETRAKFEAAIGGAPVSVPIEYDAVQVTDTAANSWTMLQNWYNNNEAQARVGVDVSNADLQLSNLVTAIMEITGLPYDVVLDAVTNPASDKAREVEALLLAITNDTYVAPVDADTSAAVTNIQNFVAFARTELAHVQAQANSINGTPIGLADGEGSMSPEQKAQYGQITRTVTTPKAVKAPAQVRAPSATPLRGIADGYNKAAEAAKKAGKESKKAAKDMADGIDDAVQAAEDYGNRLKTALMSAYNQQYALTDATDAYHSALNAITKKREDEIKQVSDLRDKVRELNDERDKELISANKAKIEQNISIKYGETGRAADYGQQATEALNNAAAKQKEIDAAKKEADTVQAGIGLLTGYSDAAIANREALRGLETKMIDMIAAYATTGHSIDEVRVFAQNLTGQFQTDVGQMGFNQTAVGNLQGSLERYIGVVNSVPQVKPTEVTADTDAAQQEVAAFGEALDWETRDRDVLINVKTEPVKGIGEAWTNVTMADGTVERVNRGQSGDYQPGGYSTGGRVMGFDSGGLVPGTPPGNPRKDNLMAKVDGKGLIGIRSREFIQPQESVDYYGLDAMEAIRTMRLPKFSMGGSPSGASGGAGAIHDSVVELGAATLAAMAEMRQEIKLFADSRELATSVNQGNKQLAAEGHR
jgi:TP901 family phage tail tape measure protein